MSDSPTADDLHSAMINRVHTDIGTEQSAYLVCAKPVEVKCREVEEEPGEFVCKYRDAANRREERTAVVAQDAGKWVWLDGAPYCSMPD
ncbi:hypothetical protein IC614_02245 [Allosphingosinicella flava]|uniref:Uncharacterized protein n=1 Tax=Allosphingosinicella flava TaxID=2771430 RepID=A0A7T2LME2_9SPHN|nr:hypothetical protein IC614_02245 [Sphingosinicella flava]